MGVNPAIANFVASTLSLSISCLPHLDSAPEPKFSICSRSLVARKAHHSRGHESCKTINGQAPITRCQSVSEKTDVALPLIKREYTQPASLCSGGAAGNGSVEPSRQTGATYSIKLVTGRGPGSGLSQPGAGLLLTLIGEGGQSIMHRVESETDAGGPDGYISMRFQTGSTDELQFKGPWVGPLRALWVAPEAGTWKFEDASVAVDVDNQEGMLVYQFPGDEVLLGDGGKSAALELKPAGAKTVDAQGASGQSVLCQAGRPDLVGREKGMKEYRDLKASLYGTTAALGGVGGAIAWAVWGPGMAWAFSVGSTAGLIYLVLLERAVDELQPPSTGQEGVSPSPSSSSDPAGKRLQGTSANDRAKGFIGGSRSPAVRLALVAGAAIAAAKLLKSGEGHFTLQPAELVAGAIGFLSYKAAVLAAALRRSDD